MPSIQTGSATWCSPSPSPPPNGLIATNPAYYATPRLLWKATPPAVPPVTLSVSGNQLTINPGGFVGTFNVEAVVSDGSSDVIATFQVTFV